MTKRVRRCKPYVLKNWTENAALKATNARMEKIDAILIEIASLWGDVDEYICGECDRLRREIETAKFDFIASVQARAEEREES